MEKTKRRKKPIIILIVVLVIIALIIGGIVACSRALTTSLEQLGAGLIEVSEVERRDIINDISVSGTVESENIVKVTTTVNGKIKKLNVDVGSEVKAGDVLCVFDSDDLQLQYDTLLKTQQNADSLTENTHKINERNLENAKTEKANSLAQAQRAIDEAIAARDAAHQKEQQLVDRYNSKAASKNDISARLAEAADPESYEMLAQQLSSIDMELQSIDSQLEALREQYASYDSAVTNAQEAYTNAERSADNAIQSYQDVLDAEQYSDNTSGKTELEKLADQIAACTVTAPKSGIVTSLNVAEGSIPTSEALMTIEDKDALKISVSIAEADILKIHEGQKAIVRTTATADKEFDAKVSRVVNIYQAGQMGANGQSTGGYSAEISVDDKDHELLIGMNAKVKIVLDEKEDVLAVPFEAIIADEDDTYHVLLAITGDDGTTRAKAAKVTPGMEGTYYTEITSDEVKVGDKVVTTPGDYKDGDILPIFDFNAAMNSANEGGADE